MKHIVYYKGTNGNGYVICMESLSMDKETCKKHLKRNGFFQNPVMPDVYYPIDKQNSFVGCAFAQIEDIK